MQKLLLILLILILNLQLFATHNRAGEITFRHIAGLQYEITVLTYTYSPSPADRPSLEISWGDGTTSIINRYQKTFIGNYTNKNLYKGTHTYISQGSFIISMEDPNRNGGVVNIPGSINVPFYIETELIINPFIGINNSAQLLYPPLDNGCVASPFLHNPAAYDPDGDSLSYELAACKGASGQAVPGFTFPNTSNIFSIDPTSGTLTWDSPTMQGEYNIAIIVYEWRFGLPIGNIRRDMQITIAACNNNPPQIQLIQDTCIEVGTNFSTLITATDVNSNQLIKLTGTGGPLALSNNPATFSQPTNGYSFVSSIFSWTPDCDQVKKQPYQMLFKVQDNGTPVNMFDLKTLKITVVAPSPKNLTAYSVGNNINLNWNKHQCSNVKRYDIYRHSGYIGYIPNSCETGVPAWTGYVKIGSTNSVNDTTFIDNNNGYGLIHGNDYCYMVVALFPDSAESYPSLEACAYLSRDVPIITHVTVDSTSSSKGEITIKWTKPTEFDTVAIPGPYKYFIYHSHGAGNLNLIEIDSIDDFNDTIYTIKNINTETIENNFRIDFLNNTPGNRYFVGGSQISSSVFLETEALDKRILLKWHESVPWTNHSYIIFRKNSIGIYDSIGQTSDQFYLDSNLTNGQNYCYKIKSVGQYSLTALPKPLENFSQLKCESPIDNESPCPPNLTVESNCELTQNLIIWNRPTQSCGADIIYYSLYFTPILNGDFKLIYQSGSPNDTTFWHTNLNSIAGCYTITATDSIGNISEFSKKVCIDIDGCEPYKLPNIFTPNNDGSNDVFRPFPYDLVRKIEITIYNRWGVPVFETEDPDINWDGNDKNSNNNCSDGVYFYVCQVYEQRLSGEIKREIRGTITLIRN
jgi:gliding motility-associated-like protein